MSRQPQGGKYNTGALPQPGPGHSYPPAARSPASSADDFPPPPSAAHTVHDPFTGQSRPAYASQPSLPRYSSHQSSQTYLPAGAGGPVNHPQASTGASPRMPQHPYGQGSPSRYSSFGPQSGSSSSNAHPLSNTMYMESSPTLADSQAMTPSDEKAHLAQGDYAAVPTQPSATPRTDGFGASTQSGAFRRAGPPRGPTKGLVGLYRRWSGAHLADSGRDERHIKLPHLGYLDGLKFLAALVVLNGTYFDAIITDNDYTAIQRDSPLYIVRSFGLGLTFLLVLMGRSLITPLWDVPSATSAAGAKSGTALISWARLTRAMLVRPFRFILPVLVIIALQWGVAATGKTSNANAVGMDEPYWGLITNFAGYCTLVFDLFTYYEWTTLAGKTFAANLWTNAWFFQGSYCAYVCHFMLGNLSSNRYWVYGIIAFFSWTTFNYFMLVIIGVVFADMHAHGHLHYIRTRWPAFLRIAAQAAAIGIALVTQWVPVLRDNINYGMSVINVQNHPELTFCDAIFATCWIFVIETSGIAQLVFGNVVMRHLGKLAAGIYLLAPTLTYTIVPDVALSLSSNGTDAGSIVGVCWVTLFAITIALSIAFHFFVELPSKLMGEFVAEMVEGTPEGEIPAGFVRAKGGKLLKKNAGGANAPRA